MQKFNSIKIGQTATIEHKITKDDIEKFVQLTGDDNKLHIDEDYASLTSFKKPVAHGMLSASFISTIIGTKLPGDGSLWYSQSIEFLKPVRIGDEIKIIAKVLKKNKKDNSIELSTDIYNQYSQKILAGLAKVKIVEQDNKSIKKNKIDKSRIALILGGSGGIGNEVCMQLAKDGYIVIIHYYKNEKNAKKIKNIIDSS